MRMPLPVIPEAAPLAVNKNADPEDAFNEIAALLVSSTLTPPLLFSVKVDALSDPFAPVEMPPVPALRFAVAAFNAAVLMIPLLVLLAAKVNDEADDELRMTPPAYVSVMLTDPVEFAVKFEAEVEVTLIPPLPADTTSVGVASANVVDTEPLAASEIEVAAVSAELARVILFAVDTSEMVLAELI